MGKQEDFVLRALEERKQVKGEIGTVPVYWRGDMKGEGERRRSRYDAFHPAALADCILSVSNGYWTFWSRDFSNDVISSHPRQP